MKIQLKQTLIMTSEDIFEGCLRVFARSHNSILCIEKSLVFQFLRFLPRCLTKQNMQKVRNIIADNRVSPASGTV